MRSTDRLLILAPKDGEKAKNAKGLIDPRLFTGENKLHAVMDHNTTLWSLRYEYGAVPPQLKQKFTSFKTLLNYVIEYFAKRDVVVKEVID